MRCENAQSPMETGQSNLMAELILKRKRNTQKLENFLATLTRKRITQHALRSVKGRRLNKP